MKKRMGVLAALLMLMPMALAGCMTNEERAARREKVEEIGQLAEQYMTDKYDRLFYTKKCEYAAGDEYEGDFFITFKDGSHAFYDSDEEKFYDDRQADTIINDIYYDMWIPMIESLGSYDGVNPDSQSFNMKYHHNNGLSEDIYSMFHEFYSGNIKSYANREHLSVHSDNLVLVSQSKDDYKHYFSTLSDFVDKRLKGQRNGEMNFYVVTSEYHSSPYFDAASLDETVDGCIARFTFDERQRITVNHYMKVADGLYAMICSDDGTVFEPGDVELVPVSDSDLISEGILNDMDSKAKGLVDTYVNKKRSIVMNKPIYRLIFSENVQLDNDDHLSVAFVMKDSDEPVYEFEKLNERENAFFAYDVDGSDFNATCLCSAGSRAGKFTPEKDFSNVYLWFGSQI